MISTTGNLCITNEISQQLDNCCFTNGFIKLTFSYKVTWFQINTDCILQVSNKDLLWWDFFYSYALKVEATQLKRLLKGGYKIITYSCLHVSGQFFSTKRFLHLLLLLLIIIPQQHISTVTSSDIKVDKPYWWRRNFGLFVWVCVCCVEWVPVCTFGTWRGKVGRMVQRVESL